MVQLGQSPVNKDCYPVCLMRVKLLITSSNWTVEVAECSRADRDWLNANTVHIAEDAACWQGGVVPVAE
eukprot:12912865-Prorocentrum_lima.AAC.1